MNSPLHIEYHNGIANIVLNNPATHNAFGASLIQQLISALNTIAEDKNTRVVIVRSEGRHFSAGADLAWMKSMVALSYDDNLADAHELARLMNALNDLPQPTIALVQGAAYGGAVGLLCCCDIVIASEAATFCLSEVKLGLAPATIAPFVVNAIGQRQARRYLLTAEVIPVAAAQQIGLVHDIVNAQSLIAEGDSIAHRIINNGPEAIKATKALIKRVAHGEIDRDMMGYTEELIAQLRISSEGQEGLSAFFEKRSPAWITSNDCK